jgi:hypothetical protein
MVFLAKGKSMHDLAARLERLERSNRRLKTWLMAVSAVLGCGVLMAAAKDGDGVFDRLLVRGKIVIGQEGQPSIVIESQKDSSGIVIADKDQRPRIMLNYVSSTKVTGLVFADTAGEAAFGAKFMEQGLRNKPITLVTLNQPTDKGSLILSAAPYDQTGVVIQDQVGRNRSRLNRKGAAVIE